MSSEREKDLPVEEILLKRLDETTLEDLRTLNSVLFPVRYAVRTKHATMMRFYALHWGSRVTV